MYGSAREARNAAPESGALPQVDPLATRVDNHLQRRTDAKLHLHGLAALLVAGVAEICAGVGLPDGGDDKGAIPNDVPLSAI
jgi:hypothetical protein